MEEEKTNRLKWRRSDDFIVSIVSFTTDTYHMVYFPFMMNKNGGWFFLVPFMVTNFLMIYPLLCFESIMGQYTGQSFYAVWKICPLLSGIGLSTLLQCIVSVIRYNIGSVWALYYIVHCFRDPLPWDTCGNEWNTMSCVKGKSKFEIDKKISSQEEFFKNKMLRINLLKEIEIGDFNQELAIYLLFIHLIIYMCTRDSIKSILKIVWVTSVMPIFTIFIMFINGITLPIMAEKSPIEYLTLKSNYSRLYDDTPWNEAFLSLIVSMGVGQGLHHTFSSYNQHHFPVFMNCQINNIINILLTVTGGFILYVHLLATTEPEYVLLSESNATIFVLFTNILSNMPIPQLWCFLFYFMVFLIGLGRVTALTDVLVYSLMEEKKELLEFLNLSRRKVTLISIAFLYVISLPFVCNGGYFLRHFLFEHFDRYLTAINLFLQLVVMCWFYGIDKISSHVNEMLCVSISWIMRIIMKYIVPTYLLYCLYLLMTDLDIPDIVVIEQVYSFNSNWRIFKIILIATPIMIIVISSLIEIRYYYKKGCRRVKKLFAHLVTPPKEQKFINDDGLCMRTYLAHYRKI